ncbi:MAG: hypothetical protein IKW59_04580 [Clostridia bacterium]|nr:hypothetical protein [Clostridia bacterium]
MKRPASFFNFAIFKSDLKRFWWVSALYSILIFVSCLLPFYITYQGYVVGKALPAERTYLNSNILNYSIFPYFLLAIIAVGTAVLLFSYLNSKSAVAQIHSVPVKRETLFITHTVFGLLTLIVPVLINAVILLLMRTNPSISQVVSVAHIVQWAHTQMSYAVIGFSFAVFIGMFTANSVAHIIFTYIFALLPLAFELAIRGLMNLHLHGYYFYGAGISATTDFLYFGIDKLCTVTYPLIYLAYSIIFLVLSLFVYKLRDLENTAEVIAFPKLKPVFVYGVSLCMGVMGYFYLVAIADITSMFLILPFGILGLIIANMVAKKAFTLKGSIKPAVALLISALAFVLLFEADITGFEKRVPKSTDIESVSVTRRSIEMLTQVRSINGAQKIEKGEYIPNLYDSEDIENVIKFHSFKTQDKKESKDKIDPIYITYNLKNGKKMVRQYSVNLRTEQDLLKPIIETDEYKRHILPVISGETENVETVNISDARFRDYRKYFAEKQEDKEVINRICEALKKDIENAKYDEFAYGESTLTTIEIEELIPWYYEGTDILVPSEERYGGYTEYYSYSVRPSYENTIAVLYELGLYDAIPAVESYNKASIRVNDFTKNADTKVMVTKEVDKEENADLIIDNPDEILMLYKYVTETTPNRYDAHRDENGYGAFDITFSGPNVNSFSTSRTTHDESLPEMLKELLIK